MYRAHGFLKTYGRSKIKELALRVRQIDFQSATFQSNVLGKNDVRFLSTLNSDGSEGLCQGKQKKHASFKQITYSHNPQTSIVQNILYCHPKINVPTKFLRLYHTSQLKFQESKEEFKVLDEKSKIEEFVEYQQMKNERKQKLKLASQKFQEAFIFKVDHSLAGASSKPDASLHAPVKKTIKQKIIDEAKHYYNGFRLLYLDAKIAARMLWQVLNGKALTRRERKQFLRTVADLFRIVPFAVFLIIPFMEFLLPVAIKLFPGMLPSTFEDKKSRDSKKRTSLKMRLQMAEFLQDTIEEIAVHSTSKKPSDKLRDFGDFMLKLRSEGTQPTNVEIMKYSKLFEDEITLENIRYDQLKAMCRLLLISPIGTGNFLRFKIKLKLQELNADDQMIRQEGIDNLTVEELQNACITRGMRALGVPVERMKSNLKQWLELSLDENIPASLLLLSRAFYMGPTVSLDQQLSVTMSQLPERLIDEMEVKIGAVEGEAVDRQTIIDIIKHEEQQIAVEKAEQEKERERQKELLTDKASDEELSKEEILKVKETISTEREELDKIKEDREEYIEDLAELKQVQEKAREEVASSRLGKRIDSLIHRIDTNLMDLEEQMHEKLPQVKIDQDADGIVSTGELFEAIQKLQNAPNEAKTQRLLEVLDQDKDGEISLEELRQAISLVAAEDLHNSQIEEVIELLHSTKRILVIRQMLDKKKSNYILNLLPTVYGRQITEP